MYLSIAESPEFVLRLSKMVYTMKHQHLSVDVDAYKHAVNVLFRYFNYRLISNQTSIVVSKKNCFTPYCADVLGSPVPNINRLA